MSQKPPNDEIESDTVDPFASIAAKRPAPPKIAPIVFDGIRYEQAYGDKDAESEQRTGFLAAFKEDTDDRIWIVKVYDLEIIEHLERDVQEVYFAKMELLPEKRQIQVENERGDQFVVNLDDQAVQPIK